MRYNFDRRAGSIVAIDMDKIVRVSRSGIVLIASLGSTDTLRILQQTEVRRLRLRCPF